MERIRIDIESIKRISIVDMLARSGIEPVSRRGTRAMYRSPLRQDANPSFAVDTERNLWMDHGSGEGGSVIDLYMKLNDLSYTDAIRLLAQDGDTLRLNGVVQQMPAEERAAAITIDKTRSCGRNPIITAYLRERGIEPHIAALTPNLCEVYYTVGDNRYFGVGFRNDSGGYELRNKYFKGCSGHKDITTLDHGSDSVLVLEGFMDFASVQAYQQESVKMDVVVLNSTAMLEKAMPFLARHKKVHAALDNDRAGDEATAKIKERLGDRVVDERPNYAQHKDFNEFLMAQKRLGHNRGIR